MNFFALQMSTNDPMFWVMIIIAVSFVVIAAAMVVLALIVSRVVRTVVRLEERVEPMMQRVTELSQQVTQIAQQGREVAAQVGTMSGHLSTATMHFSESMAMVKDEVRELKQLVGRSAEVARDRVELMSRSFDQTHQEISQTANFIRSKLVEPARELAAIMAGVRRGLEVFVAPQPKPINQIYGEDELFIG